MDERKIKKIIRGNATSRLKGYLYQFMVALDYCFDLGHGQSLYIETYGDLAILNNGEDDIEKEEISIEVKMYNENDELDIKHPNFLKTLYNWSEDVFNYNRYKHLILFTTQRIKEKDPLFEWNLKSPEDKYQIVSNVYTTYITENIGHLTEKDNSEEHKYIEGNIKKMEYVLNSVKENGKVNQTESAKRLKDILSRVQIIEKQDDYLSFYENNLLTKRAYMEDKDKKEIFINSLLGIILNPILVNSKWEISYEYFRKELDILNNSLAGKKRIFPSIELPENISVDDNALFLKKLREIDFDKIEEAISEYAKVSKYIEEETSVMAINTSFNNYKNDLIEVYENLFDLHSMKEIKDINQESKVFLFTVFNESRTVKFSIYDRIEPYFRKGLYHNLANDESNNIRWKLK